MQVDLWYMRWILYQCAANLAWTSGTTDRAHDIRNHQNGHLAQCINIALVKVQRCVCVCLLSHFMRVAFYCDCPKKLLNFWTELLVFTSYTLLSIFPDTLHRHKAYCLRQLNSPGFFIKAVLLYPLLLSRSDYHLSTVLPLAYVSTFLWLGKKIGRMFNNRLLFLMRFQIIIHHYVLK